MIKWFKIYFKLVKKVREVSEANQYLKRAVQLELRKNEVYYTELVELRGKYKRLLRDYKALSVATYNDLNPYLDYDKEETN